MSDEYDIKKIFEEIELELIASMKRTLWLHKEDESAKDFNWPQWQALKLKQIQQYRIDNKEIFDSKAIDVDRHVIKHMKQQFKEAAAKTNKRAIKLGIISNKDSEFGGSFFGLNTRKLDSLINSAKNDLRDVRTATLRMANDQFRQVIYKSQMYANMGVGTVQQAIDMATKDFLSRGFNCIEYKNGRRINIADYCDMSIKTAYTRAGLAGDGEIRKKIGNPLVYVSKHEGTCDKCSKWAGRVYIDDVWSGGKEEDGKYPLLSTAIAGGLFHPRCQHRTTTYFEGINEEPEEIQENEHNNNDVYIQDLQRRKKQYERLAAGSLYTDNIQDYSNKAANLQNQIESSKIELLEDEQYAMNRYIASESYKINEALRNEMELTQMQEKIMHNLDSALEKMPNYNGNIVRTMQIDDDFKLRQFIDSLEVGKPYKPKEYLSFSDKLDYNLKSNVDIFVENSKKGKDLRAYNKEESEIIYKRDSKFRVLNKKLVNGKHYILLEEVYE